MTDDLKRIIEQSVLRDMECLSSLITDIRLVREYISFNLIDKDNENDWQMMDGQDDGVARGMDGVLWMRHQQLLAAKLVLSTRVPTPSRRSLGPSLLRRDALESSILSMLITEDLDFYERASSSNEHKKAYLSETSPSSAATL